MTSTVDTAVLLHASDRASAFHRPALQLLERLCRGPEPLYLLWPVVFAYHRLSTHAGVFERPLAEADATRNIETLLGLPTVRAIGGDDGFWQAFPRIAGDNWLRGDFVAQGYLVGLMRDHGVGTLWSRDRSYRRFEGISVRDPFAPSAR